MKNCDYYEINEVLSNILLKNEPASILRIDNTSGYAMQKLFRNAEPSRQILNEQTLIEAGIYSSSLDYIKQTIYPKTIDIMKSVDVLGFVDISNEISRDTDFLSQFNSPYSFFNPAFTILDPGSLVGLGDFNKLEHPWTENLKNKKVLTISSHHNSINQQYDKLDLIWKENKEKIVPFEFVGNIRSPFHPLIDDRQYADNFEDTVEFIKKEIDKFDFDVLLSSVSHQSPFYVEYAKQKGKIGIQTGGVLQLFFGIIGKRWDMNNCYRNWRNIYNENWIYPLKEDEPQKIDSIRHLEFSFAYWSGK